MHQYFNNYSEDYNVETLAPSMSQPEARVTGLNHDLAVFPREYLSMVYLPAYPYHIQLAFLKMEDNMNF